MSGENKLSAINYGAPTCVDERCHYEESEDNCFHGGGGAGFECAVCPTQKKQAFCYNASTTGGFYGPWNTSCDPTAEGGSGGK